MNIRHKIFNINNSHLKAQNRNSHNHLTLSTETNNLKIVRE